MGTLKVAAIVAVLLAAYVLGIVLGRRKVAPLSAAVCLLFLLVRIIFRYRPDIEYGLFSFPAYVHVRTWWPFWFGIVIFGVGASRASTQVRRMISATVAGIVLAFPFHGLFAGVTRDAWDLTGRPDYGGLCMQTQSWTCGPAAAATILAELGIESDEREMAMLCDALPLTGTDAVSMCFGLRRKLEGTGYRVQLRHSNWDDLLSEPLPALAQMNVDFLLDHWVVLLEIRGNGVLAGDPTRGRIVLSKDDFVADWRNVLITVDRPSGPRENKSRDMRAAMGAGEDERGGGRGRAGMANDPSHAQRWRRRANRRAGRRPARTLQPGERRSHTFPRHRGHGV